MRRATCAAVLIFASLWATRGRADDAPEVVVRGGGAGGFVSRATVDDAPREVTDAASLIEPLPGVHVRRLGADDSFATLSIRGSTSSQIAVFLAGVPLTGGADPTLDLSTLPLWPGAGVRVYRSFAPATLGRGSLGGTLVLEPPSPRSPTGRTETWGAVGSFGSLRLRVADIRGAEDGVRVATGLSASRSTDDFRYLDPLATAATGADTFATRANAGHAAAAGLVSVAVPLTFGQRRGALTFTGLAQARNQKLPGTVKAPTPFQELHTTRLVAAAEGTLPAGPATLSVRGWGRREGLAVRDAPTSAALTLGPSSTNDAIYAAGGTLALRARGEAMKLEGAVDGSYERFDPSAWVLVPTPAGASRGNVGAAIDAGARAGPVDFEASGRADTWFDAEDGGANSAHARPSGHVGAETRYGASVFASHLGFLSRPPSFVERFGNRGAFLGEPNLRPESAITADVGGRASGRVGAIALGIDLAAFATWAEDLITFVNQGAYGRARATNIGLARLQGIEATTTFAVAGFEARLSYTGLVTANASACRFGGSGGCDRPALPGRPAHDVVFDVAFTRGPVRVRYGLDGVFGTRADLTGNVIVPDRILQGAGVRVALPRVTGLTLAMDLRNVFDVRVAEYAGALGPVRAPIGDAFEYPLPGRTFLASLRWRAERERP